MRALGRHFWVGIVSVILLSSSSVTRAAWTQPRDGVLDHLILGDFVQNPPSEDVRQMSVWMKERVQKVRSELIRLKDPAHVQSLATPMEAAQIFREMLNGKDSTINQKSLDEVQVLALLDYFDEQGIATQDPGFRRAYSWWNILNEDGAQDFQNYSQIVPGSDPKVVKLFVSDGRESMTALLAAMLSYQKILRAYQGSANNIGLQAADLYFPVLINQLTRKVLIEIAQQRQTLSDFEVSQIQSPRDYLRLAGLDSSVRKLENLFLAARLSDGRNSEMDIDEFMKNSEFRMVSETIDREIRDLAKASIETVKARAQRTYMPNSQTFDFFEESGKRNSLVTGSTTLTGLIVGALLDLSRNGFSDVPTHAVFAGGTLGLAAGVAFTIIAYFKSQSEQARVATAESLVRELDRPIYNQLLQDVRKAQGIVSTYMASRMECALALSFIPEAK